METQTNTSSSNKLPATTQRQFGVDASVCEGVAGEAERGWLEALGPVGVGKILLISALVGWFYGDHLYRLYRVWQEPDWSHGFLIPVFCLWLVYLKRSELLSDRHIGSLWGLVLMVASVLAYALSIRLQFGYPQPLTLLTMIAGIMLLLRGWRTLRITAFPIMFLFLAIPPPVRLYREFTQPLQQIAAWVSSLALNTFPHVIEVERAGVNLAYYMEGGDHGTFTVAGACSGMRSLMAFVALGLAMAYLSHRPMWHRIIFAICVVPVALFCNILRVIISGGLQMYGHPELASGTPHTLLGLMMFGLGFTMFLSLLWILDHLFVEETAEEEMPDGLQSGGRG